MLHLHFTQGTRLNVINFAVLTLGPSDPELKTLKGAMGEISNFYNFSPRLFIFGTHIPPIISIHAAKLQ